MKLSDLKNAEHWPTLLTAFLYFDFSFMVWTVLGPLGAQIGETLKLSPEQKGLMVALPILAGAVLRILLGLLVDRVGAKNAGIMAQLVVITGLALAWVFGLPTYQATLLLGLVLGFAGASFAVALPQAGRWYPPNMQGVVMGLAGAGNIGVVLDSLVAPRIAEAYGWKNVFGCALIPALLVLILYAVVSKEAPGEVKQRKLSDYLTLLKDPDAHWFCFYYTISFGGCGKMFEKWSSPGIDVSDSERIVSGSALRDHGHTRLPDDRRIRRNPVAAAGSPQGGFRPSEQFLTRSCLCGAGKAII
jgi:MFS transporter, NNP family, nitrate/nitrite transporter